MNIEDRIIDLEIKFTYQEDTISQLNDVIFSQQKTIDALESRLAQMEFVLERVMTPGFGDPSKEPPPPHY